MASLFLQCLALIGLLGFGCVLVGRLIVVFARIELLRRPDPETMVGCAFVGTGFLTLGYGWGSYAGLPAKGCLLLVFGLIAAMLFGARGRLGEIVRRPTRGGVCLALVAIACAQAALLQLALLLCGAYLYFSDALFYFSVAEWLQHHGFGLTRGEQPVIHTLDFNIWGLHRMSHRMGPMFFLALIKALAPGWSTAFLFPVVQTWGAVLNVGGIFLLCRWTFRLPRAASLAGAALAATTCHSLTFSCHWSFFCQIYGTAVLAFGLALASRLQAPRHWTRSNAALVGLMLATQASMYSELIPILGLAFAGSTIVVVVRKRLLRPAAHFAMWSGAFVGLLANVEIYRAVKGILFMSSLSGVGWHISWNGIDYARFTLGLLNCLVDTAVPLTRGSGWVFGAIALLLFATGIGWQTRRRAALPAMLALGAVGALALHFRFDVLDPWTNQPGQTWNLFKLAKWSFPIVAGLQACGLAWLASRTRWPNPILATAVLSLAAISLHVHEQMAARFFSLQTICSGPHSTLHDFDRLKEKLDAFGGTPVYFAITDPDHAPSERRLYQYVISLPQTGCAKGPLGPREMIDGPAHFLPEDAIVLAHCPDASVDGAMPFGFYTIDSRRPQLIAIKDCLGNPSGGWNLGGQAVSLWIFSARERDIALSFDVRVSDGASTSVRMTCPDGDVRTLTWTTSSNLRQHMRVPSGVSTVFLHREVGGPVVHVTGVKVE
jgi:hypothetical protein